MRSWSSTTRSGSVLLDDGTELPFDREAFEASGLRLLRFGQRVRLVLDRDDGDGNGGDGGGQPRVSALTLITLPLR